MIIKKIGTTNLGKPSDTESDRGKREDETTSLEALRNSLGAGNTMPRGQLLEGRYEVEQVIGYGGMSTVYRARDIHFASTVRVCAIKEMFDVSADPNVRQDKLKRFEEEANFLAMLNHVSIPKIFDFFAANDRRYLVLEYIEGKNLETVLEERGAPFEEEQVLEWGITLCDVLHYLHNHRPKPIVFRDMKPSNIMITSENRLVLIDFGIAKTFQEDKKGTMIGTEGYSPPEQYKGLALPGGDIYALGATLHQMLTNSDPRNEVPFTFHERLPRILNPRTSPEIEAVVMKALEFDIAKRWLSVEEFRQALIRVRDRNATQPTGGKASEAPNIRNTMATGLNPLTGGIVAARGAGLSGLNPTGNRSDNQTNATNNRFRQPQAVEETEVQASLDDLPMGELVWSFASEEEIRNNPVVHNGMVFFGSYDSNLYALEAQKGEFLWKAPTTGGVCTVPSIADRAVVVGSEDGMLYAFDIDHGNQLWNYRTSGPVRSSARYYSPMIFFGSDDQYIYCVEARTGRQVWKQRTWAPVRSTPTVVSGTVYIGSMDGHLYALDGNNGNIKWKFRALEGIISSPLVHENLAFVGSLDNNLYCIDTVSSWRLWKYKTNSYVNSSPIFYNGKIYVGSVDGYLYCIEAKNGRLVWKFNTGKQVTSSPRVADGTVYFGGVDGNLYALDAEKGTPRWFYPTEGPITSSPAIDNGHIYIGSLDYRLYSLTAPATDK
jgi:outer membrane protein assembly factor BamB/tRNA A-37 threonylcarbamoyl transferase component Bud32